MKGIAELLRFMGDLYGLARAAKRITKLENAIFLGKETSWLLHWTNGKTISLQLFRICNSEIVDHLAKSWGLQLITY